MTKLGVNLYALQAKRRLDESSQALTKTFERLSSGLRINRASDDSAGLAIATKLRADQRVFTQGIRNLNDGLSLTNIADGAISALTQITTRLQELAEQAANGTYTKTQRRVINEEAQALSKEYTRIIQSTVFNGRQILTADFGELSLQAGFGTQGVIRSSLGGIIGTGSFGAETSYTTEEGTSGTYSNDVTLADINNDNILDLITAGITNSNGYVTTRLGLGGGTFGAAVSYLSESTASTRVELHDLNGDGLLDLVTAGYDGGGGRVSVRLGVGGGSFGSTISYLMESGKSHGLALGDLNDDGIIDIVSAGETGVSGGGRFTVRLGASNGTFGNASSFATGADDPRSVRLGDVNRDGILDVVTVGSFGGSAWSTVSLGSGSGSFAAAVSYVAESAISKDLALGDVNNDGNLDIVSAGYGPAGKATIRLGNGNGTFGSALSYDTESTGTLALTLGDLNGDGNLDLITSGHGGGSGRITIRLGNGNGTFGQSTSYLMESSNSVGVTVGDLNGDSVLDVVTAGYYNSNSGTAHIRLGNTTSGTSALLTFDLTTQRNARQALTLFSNKLDQLTLQHGHIGSFQSRLGFATNHLRSQTDVLAEAESRIMDADIAEEAAKMVRLSILQQAATAVLAQANLQPQLALKLLTG